MAVKGTDTARTPRVQVLLATYNGAKFLAEQMESLLVQDYPRVEILARDDGSKDDTKALLESFTERFPKRVRVLRYEGSRGSAQGNFARLLEVSDAPYVCLCDQDDVWVPQKVSVEMAAMRELEARHGEHTPLLIFSDLRVVDEQLRTLQASFWRHEGLDPESVHRLRSVLHQNVVTGCTMMLNRSLVAAVLPIPEESPMHDRWIALVAAAIGKSRYVCEPLVLYRQHGGNVVGASSDTETLAEMMKRSRRSEGRLEQWRVSQRLAATILLRHGERMSTGQRDTVEAFLRCGRSSSRWVRVGTMVRYGFFRKGLLRNMATIWELWRLKAEDRRVF